VEAVQAAGLADTLKSTGLLTAVLTYHVLPSRVTAANIPFGEAIETVQGDIFKIDNTPDGPVITDGRNRTSNIKVTNLYARNGVIHGIDKVILPADQDIVETALALAPEFSILVEAVEAAGLVATLQGEGPFTVFAPTNAAFVAALDELSVSKETLFANTALLTQILTYHVLPARVLKAEVPIDTAITTVEGTALRVNSSLQIVDAINRTAGIVTTDVLTSNGVIHVIDKVILPALPPG